jgi:MoaA/NifB/PqqE/SkfB family radical SAM enzyme
MAMYVDSRKDELSTFEVFSLLEEVAKLGTRWIYYFGGEPLLRGDILELVSYGQKLGLKSRLDTNGYLLSEKTVGELRRSGLDKIGVSIDDPDPVRHNALRNLPGLFEKAIEAIKYCVQEDLYCYISTYATKENINNGRLKSLIGLAESLRVNHIRILFPACSGKFLHMPEIRLTLKERQKMLNMVGKSDFVFFEEKVSDRLDEGYCASVRKAFIYISFHGEVQPCPFVPISFGTIRSEPLAKIIQRMWRHSLFELDPDECIMNNDLFRGHYVPKMESGRELPLGVA